MLPAPRPRLRGFTLLELLATFTLVAVLATLATMSGMAVRTRVQNTAAHDLLVGTAGAEALYYRDRGAFVDDPASMAGLSGNTRYVDGATAAAVGTVSAAAGLVGSDSALALATASASGVCLTLVTFAPAAGRADVSTVASADLPCSGAAALATAAG